MKIQNSPFLSIQKANAQYQSQIGKAEQTQENKSLDFSEILNKKTSDIDSELKFSKHAVNRLTDRKIELTQNQLQRLGEGANKAEQKGIAESLVLVDQLAFIVNTKNNTVITAMDQKETNENIFTNIDGAVIM